MSAQLQYRAHTLHGLGSAVDGVNLLFTREYTAKLLVEL